MAADSDNVPADDRTEVTVFEELDPSKLAPTQGKFFPLLATMSKVASFDPYQITKRRVDIGRSGTNDITIDRPNVSRLHASIYYDNIETPGQQPVCILEDRNSRNGTFVNRKALKGQHALKDGDSILIGDCVIGFFLKSEAEISLEKNIKDALARHGLKSDMRRISSDFRAQLDVMIPEETFTPKGIQGIVKDINMNGLRFTTQFVSRDFWQRLLKDKRHIQCQITFDEGEQMRVTGKLAWIHYDNRVQPETCAMGVEFSDLDQHAVDLLKRKLDELEGGGG